MPTDLPSRKGASLIRDRRKVKRLPFCGPGSRFARAWDGAAQLLAALLDGAFEAVYGKVHGCFLFHE